MKKVCYVINFWLGERRVNVHRFHEDKLCYLKSQIETLKKYKHSLPKIVFTFNVEPEHYQLLSEALKIIPKRIQGAEIEVNIRENIGMSYGAFSDIFEKYMDEYDYYIFNEDDYVIVDHQFDDYLVNKFESLPNCGYLCGLVREKAHNKPIRHAGMSSGISSYKCLKELYDKFGELPYSKGKDYHMNEVEGQTMQTVEIRKLGYEVYDIREEYRLRFWALDDNTQTPDQGKINIHFVWNDRDLFLPAKIYFNEPCRWIDRVDDDFLRMECDYNSKKFFRYELSPDHPEYKNKKFILPT